mmetsp:Transcript_7085/g.11924  ORF Transcript_7085/g.11924 Transcript_7085/m.11924 type:complete len:436 (-) Transcript_7085:265-1572(-)
MPILGFHVYARLLGPYTSYTTAGTGTTPDPTTDSSDSSSNIGTAYSQPTRTAAASAWQWLGVFGTTTTTTATASSATAGGGGGVTVGVITLSNLLPVDRYRYQFRVAAYNLVGLSQFSVLSNAAPVRTGASSSGNDGDGAGAGTISDHYHVFGWGHTDYFGPKTAEYLKDHHHHHHHHATAGAPAASASLSQLLTTTTSSTIDAFAATESSSSSRMCHQKGHMVTIQSARTSPTGERIIYHPPCNHPATGAQLKHYEIWRSHWTSPSISITAEAVLAQPPFLHTKSDKRTHSSESYPPVGDDAVAGVAADMGAGATTGKLMVALRGMVPFVDKAVQAQNEGAIALLIVDWWPWEPTADASSRADRCQQFDQKCLPGSDKSRGEGFGAIDVQSHWEMVRIPVYFIRRSSAVSLFKDVFGDTLDWVRAMNDNNKDEL